MTGAAELSALADLARAWGVQLEYADIEGRVHRASPEAVLALLKALGAPVESPADAADGLRRLQRRWWETVMEPVAVCWEGAPLVVDLRLPEAAAHGRIRWSLQSDPPSQGESWAGDLKPDELPQIGRWKDGEDVFDRLRLPLPGGLPAGYYRLAVEAKGRAAEALVVSAPGRLGSGDGESQWGVFAPLAGLRSRDQWGAGDFRDLKVLADFVAARGGGFVGILPVLPTFLEEAADWSPYRPVSRRFWSEFYLSVPDLPGWAECAEARRVASSAEFAAELGRLRSGEWVDYPGVMAAKRRVLEVLAEYVDGGGSVRSGEFRAFAAAALERGEGLADYARFRAFMRARRQVWQDWPHPYRDGLLPPDECDPREVRYQVYVQWAAARQLEEFRKGSVGLYLDLPLGVHPSGYDTYRERASFLMGVSTGAPPDPLAPGGQDWGFPPPHPRHQRRDGYRWFREVLGFHFSAARILRLDHVMALHRLFCLPSGCTPAEGLYLSYPADELYAVLVLEAQRHGVVVVGEDLGTVPDEVRAEMDRRGVLRMYVLPFEVEPGLNQVRTPPRDSLAVLNTHDMAPFRAFWEGTDLDLAVSLGRMTPESAEVERKARAAVIRTLERRLAGPDPEAGFGSVGEARRAAWEFLARSPARLVMLSLEDMEDGALPYNVPGTTDCYPNWRRRSRWAVEDLADFAGAADLEVVARARRISRAAGEPESAPAVSLLSGDDLHWFNEGSHLRAYNHLGAHPLTADGVPGTYFAVWAPDAERVWVMGDWTEWHRRPVPLRSRGDSGIWEGFVPGVGGGALYKYLIQGRDGAFQPDKSDPFAFYGEVPPRTASVVWDLAYRWGDGEWMATRWERNRYNAPISIYELHLGSWRRKPEEGDRPLTYRELAEYLPDYLVRMGFTHVEFMPVMEHPFYGSWGYQVTGYFAPTSRYGTPQDLMYLIDRLHQAGVGVILDWVPSHFPADGHGLARFDGSHLYEHADPRQGHHPDWNSCIFNYQRHEVRSFLLSSAMFWLDKYHADGLRVDAVASMLYLDYSRPEGGWVPNANGGRENLDAIAFLRRLNTEVYRHYPDVLTVAEESTAWPMVSRPVEVGGLGFGFKWDMGWMHDTLRYLSRDPVHRKWHHRDLTFRSLYAFFENFILPLSHDEVVYGKGSLLRQMPGDDWQRFANLRLLYAYMWAQAGKKLLFMGDELAPWNEWYHERSLDWHLTEYAPHRGVQLMVAELNRLYRAEPALHAGDCVVEGFEWIAADEAEVSVYAFMRRAPGAAEVLAAVNATPVPRRGFRLGVSGPGRWGEVFNSDAREYFGTGEYATGEVEAQAVPAHGRGYSLELNLPPLAVVYLKRIG